MAFDRSNIERYEKQADELALAIRGLDRDDLLVAPPTDDHNVGKWTIQQVVIHLADSEGVLADRIKRVIAEDNPMLLAFDENKWAGALAYQERSAEDAARLVELTRKQVGQVLHKLPDSAFARIGTHSETGKKTLADLITGAANHLEHHLKFIHAKRAAMGKEMW
jgi:DinB family protein